jgi:hypothetical protein
MAQPEQQDLKVIQEQPELTVFKDQQEPREQQD